MGNWKVRLFGVILILVFVVIIVLNWRTLNTEGHYSLKMAAFGPVGVVGGLFILICPTKAGPPQTTRDKILVIGVMLIGLLAGLANWYLMDPAFFGIG